MKTHYTVSKLYMIADGLYRVKGEIYINRDNFIVYKDYLINQISQFFKATHQPPIRWEIGYEYSWRCNGWACFINNKTISYWRIYEIQPLTYHSRYLSSISNISADLPLCCDFIRKSRIDVSAIDMYF